MLRNEENDVKNRETSHKNIVRLGDYGYICPWFFTPNVKYFKDKDIEMSKEAGFLWAKMKVQAQKPSHAWTKDATTQVDS